MGDEWRAYVERLLANEAADAGATEDMDWLGSVTRVSAPFRGPVNPSDVSVGEFRPPPGRSAGEVYRGFNPARVSNFEAGLATLPVGLEALANLTNLRRGREEGFGANVEGARGVYRDFLESPEQFQNFERYFEEINYPFPGVASLLASVAEPGLGEAKQVLGFVLPRVISRLGLQRGSREVAEFVARNAGRNADDVFAEGVENIASALSEDGFVRSHFAGNERTIRAVAGDLEARLYRIRDNTWVITSLENVGAPGGRAFIDAANRLTRLADELGITFLTAPSAFGSRRLSTGELREMYSKMGFVLDNLNGATMTRNPLPLDEASRVAAAEARRDLFNPEAKNRLLTKRPLGREQ